MINESVFENFPQLESERLIFREIKVSDAADIQFIRSNDQVMSYMERPKHLSKNDSEIFILKKKEAYRNKKGIYWAIIEKSTEEFIGDFAFGNIIKENARAEIGYTLKPQFWGKGYMKETMVSLINFGFNDLKLHSFEADVNPENENSKKALIKMGFKKEAYFRENLFFNGEFFDSEVYSLLERDFIYHKKSTNKL
ncbi:GNAT family N-acetyltransferase [Xanthovirga aplysinae]|uniref:GNAT family N-acetyltransferase n=1 Tax=Xanthovirga aplysinae TaxID=2529853 RepID=UPI0012BD0EDC|nr:GNAT family N-acetyltransferase [Xanthovirga aplysinae]MTI32739.1 N-acetyltransferase [Xanthovirga aplysinae]